jgi:hypothetical protein
MIENLSYMDIIQKKASQKDIRELIGNKKQEDICQKREGNE